MPYKIVADDCTVCAACETECPNDAISLVNDMFVIDTAKCTECVGHFDEAQCVLSCPVDCIVVDESVPRYAGK